MSMLVIFVAKPTDSMSLLIGDGYGYCGKRNLVLIENVGEDNKTSSNEEEVRKFSE